MPLVQSAKCRGLGDGADGILRQLAVNLPSLDQFMLDFYHFREHVWSASNACGGLASQEARTWAEDLWHQARHEGPANPGTSYIFRGSNPALR